MLFISGISIAFFISALLAVKKEKSLSNTFLLLWMLLNAIHLSFFYLFDSGTIFDYPHLLGIQFPFPLLHGVLLYYYVAAVTNQLPKKRYLLLLHLIPTLLTYVYLIHFFLLSGPEKLMLFKNEGKGYEVFQTTLLTAIFLSGTLYVIWCLFLLKRHRGNILNQFSATEEVNLNWLRFLVYGLGVIWAVVILTRNDQFIYGGVSLFVILIGFFGIQQKSIFNEQLAPLPPAAPNHQEKLPEKEKYQRSGLSVNKADQYYEQLTRLMTEEALYKEPELSLRELAEKLEIHPNYLSQIINEKEQKNFYEYINAFRIAEFLRLVKIPDNKQYTLIALAYDCGFNSKSSFNRYFKKIVGQTPSQYVRELRS